jgi:hypothetical protein
MSLHAAVIMGRTVLTGRSISAAAIYDDVDSLTLLKMKKHL